MNILYLLIVFLADLGAPYSDGHDHDGHGPWVGSPPGQ